VPPPPSNRTGDRAADRQARGRTSSFTARGDQPPTVDESTLILTPDVRDQAVARILEASNAAGVEMLYVRDSAEAMEHARKRSLLP
jgi:hypothetical protein